METIHSQSGGGFVRNRHLSQGLHTEGRQGFLLSSSDKDLPKLQLFLHFLTHPPMLKPLTKLIVLSWLLQKYHLQVF